jgi:hypothetical protein
MINGKAARTLYNSETSLTVLFVPEEFFPGPGSYPVEVIGSDDFVMVEAVPPQKDVSYTVAPVDGQNTGAAMYLRLSEYAGVLNDPQYPDGTSDLLDEDIVSIDWGDGTTSTAPYTRVPRPPLTGQFMTHTYTSDAAGPVTIVADLNDVTCDQGSLTVAYTNTIYYYISQNPQSGGVLVGAPFGVRPIDLAGTVLPADEHFASINWGDGTTQPPPFTVDGGGYATHTYAAAGTFTVSATFINNQSGLTTVPVTAVATQEELDAFNAAYDEQNVDQHQGRDDKRDDKE